MHGMQDWFNVAFSIFNIISLGLHAISRQNHVTTKEWQKEANMFMGGQINMSIPPEKSPGMP